MDSPKEVRVIPNPPLSLALLGDLDESIEEEVESSSDELDMNVHRRHQ